MTDADAGRGRPRRLQRPGDARPGRRRPAGAARGAPVPQRRRSGCPTASTGTCSGSTRTSWSGCGTPPGPPSSAAGGWPGWRSTPGRSTTGCSTSDGALVGNPRHYRDARTEPVIDERAPPGRPGASCTRRTGLQHLPFNTLYQLAAEPGLQPAGGRCSSRTCSATGSPARSSPRRPTPPPPACSTPAPASGTAPLIERARPAGRPAARRRAGRAGSSARCRAAVRGRARDRPRRRAQHRGLARHRLRGRRRPGRDPEVRLHLLRHLGAGRRRARRPGAHRGQPAGRTSPTSAASTAPSATCAT